MLLQQSADLTQGCFDGHLIKNLMHLEPFKPKSKLIFWPITRRKLSLLLFARLVNSLPVSATTSPEIGSGVHHQPNIHNLLTLDPYQQQSEISSVNSYDNSSPIVLDKFRIEDAKFLTKDPYDDDRDRKQEKLVEKNDDDDVYYKDGNFYYDDVDYFEDESNPFPRLEDYYFDQFYDEEITMNAGKTDGKWPKSGEKVLSNQIDLNAEKVIEDGSGEVSVNTDYLDNAAPHNNVVYSTPYSKIEMVNKSIKSQTSTTNPSSEDSEKEDENIVVDRFLSSQTPPVKITEMTHDVRRDGGEEFINEESKIMLVTPSSTSYKHLTNKLSLDDIHNFTYEGFNLVDLYKEALLKKKKIKI